MDKLLIELNEYSTTCGDGCCTDYGTTVKVNGTELACTNLDTGTIIKQILEHLGYEVEIKSTYNGEEDEIDYIPINIWDDYYEDDYVPEGEKQETYIYVEDTGIEQDKRRCILEIFLNYLNNNIKLDKDNVKLELYFHDTINDYSEDVVKRAIENYGETFFFKRWEIKVEGLTHKRLHKLLKQLEKSNLSFENKPFHIYSES